MINEAIIDKIKAGAKVKVHQNGVATFEGLVIARKHGEETGATFTVRAVVAGVGVEKTFPIHAPSISKVDIVSAPKKVHRAKAYWVRKASGARIRQKLGVSV